MIQRHINVPVFVPHLGCPNNCIFCNQKKITGCNQYDYDSARQQIISQLKTTNRKTDNVQIAFFGGSFTGIERDSMISMLEVANEFINNGQVASVRLSTRPDYINEEILEILKKYNVTDIELGIQSMNDHVLNKAGRGHSSEDSLFAAKLIQDFEINFVGQMMVGLPYSDIDKENFTAKAICDMGAVAVRIYPTLVFQNTELEKLYNSGEYAPLSIEEASYRCSKLIKIFEENNVKVIRLGLCETDNLRTEGSVIAGPYHPAIGELSENRYYLDKILRYLEGKETHNRNLIVSVSQGSLSKAIGQKKLNKSYLQNNFSFKSIKFTENADLIGRDINISVY